MRAGTIVASNYTAMAQVLGESFFTHHPNSTFVVLVVDDGPCDFPAPIEVVRLRDLDLGAAALNTMKTIYDVMEFSTAVKPSLLRLLLEADEVACYLDPDIVVYSPFDDIVEASQQHGIVLTPHALTPVPRDGKRVDEGTIMQSGMYNCGFLAVSSQATDFLNWWDERLRFDALVDFENARFTDQRWVDWVPSLFDYTICRDPGMNIAWWNIHERPIELVDGVPQIAETAIRFVHFSGYDPANPELLSKHQMPSPRVAHSEGTPMRLLADAYGEQLRQLGHVERRRQPYPWNTSVDGVELTADVRHMVRSSILAELESGATLGTRATPDGFGGGVGDLSSWLTPGTIPVHEANETVPSGLAVEPRPAGRLGLRDRAQWLLGQRDILKRAKATARSRMLGRARRSTSTLAENVGRPFAFLHIPKSAGSSIVAGLRASMGDHQWSPYVFDDSMLGQFQGVPTNEPLRSRVLMPPEGFGQATAVAGHFSLPTLLSRFESVDIAMVVREPRSRLLSHYEYWRGLPAEVHQSHQPWTDSESAVDANFVEWMHDLAVIHQTDNIVVRHLMADDPAIPASGQIPNAELARLARGAVARMRRFGWVGLVELGDATWTSLGERVGHQLVPEHINATKRRDDRPTDLDAVLGEAGTRLITARTAGDMIVWNAVAARLKVDNPAVLANVAWMRRINAALHGAT